MGSRAEERAKQDRATTPNGRVIATTSPSTINVAITSGMSVLLEYLSLGESANGIGNGWPRRYRVGHPKGSRGSPANRRTSHRTDYSFGSGSVRHAQAKPERFFAVRVSQCPTTTNRFAKMSASSGEPSRSSMLSKCPIPLALHQFDALLLDRYPVQGFDDDFRHVAHGWPCGHAQDSAMLRRR